MSKEAVFTMKLEPELRAEDLEDLPTPAYKDHVKLTALFDMDRSGAGITWDYFNPGTPRPKRAGVSFSAFKSSSTNVSQKNGILFPTLNSL